MTKYPEIVGQLVSAAYDQGMSKQTLSLRALLMEAMGFRVALQAQFPNLTFILARPHLKQHLYESAEAIGLAGLERHKWVSDKLSRLQFAYNGCY